MQIRKLQSTSAGTFILTIPKGSIEKLSLSKGDLVSVDLEENSIVVSPANSRPSSQTRSIQIEQFKDQKLLELCITASYIQGHDVTEIVSSSKMHPDQKRWVRLAVEDLIGVEITEDYADRVVLQNLVDPSRFEIDKLMERFFATSKAVFLDGIKALAEPDLALAQDAFERGEESTKSYRLLMRLAFQAARNRKIREDMKLADVPSVLHKVMAIRELGRIAYYAMRIAQHVGEIERRLDESTISGIQKMAKVTAEMEDQAFASLMNKDLNLANSVIDRMPHVRKLYESARPLVEKQPDRAALSLSLIIRDIRAIAGYSVAIADVAVLGVFAS